MKGQLGTHPRRRHLVRGEDFRLRWDHHFLDVVTQLLLLEKLVGLGLGRVVDDSGLQAAVFQVSVKGFTSGEDIRVSHHLGEFGKPGRNRGRHIRIGRQNGFRKDKGK